MLSPSRCVASRCVSETVGDTVGKTTTTTRWWTLRASDDGRSEWQPRPAARVVQARLPHWSAWLRRSPGGRGSKASGRGGVNLIHHHTHLRAAGSAEEERETKNKRVVPLHPVDALPCASRCIPSLPLGTNRSTTGCPALVVLVAAGQTPRKPLKNGFQRRVGRWPEAGQPLAREQKPVCKCRCQRNRLFALRLG